MGARSASSAPAQGRAGLVQQGGDVYGVGYRPVPYGTDATGWQPGDLEPGFAALIEETSALATLDPHAPAGDPGERHSDPGLAQAVEDYLLGEGGYRRAGVIDPVRAIDTVEVLSFLGATQAAALRRLAERSGGIEAAQRALLDALCAALAERGAIAVLRGGIEVAGQHLDLAYFPGEVPRDPEQAARCDANRLGLTRRAPTGPGRSPIGLVLFCNGLPVVTAEVAEPHLGESIDDALARHYEHDPRSTLLARRTAFHFVLDNKHVRVATRLEGEHTPFEPFDQGGPQGSAGNAPTGDLYRTTYLWESVWRRDEWLDLLGRFVADDGRRVIWPRWHQLDLVRSVLADVDARGVGQRYLVQHSAGAGRSLTLAWLANGLAARLDKGGRRLFYKVVVVSERAGLPDALRLTLPAWETTATDSVPSAQDLARAFGDEGPRLIVVGPDKLPHVFARMKELPGKHFALLTDELRSALNAQQNSLRQGSSLRSLKASIPHMTAEIALADAERWEQRLEERTPDVADEIATAMAVSGVRSNASLVFFSRSPSERAQRLFGRKTSEGQLEVWHRYPVRRAIEEGRLVDVMAHYVQRLDIRPHRVEPKAEAIVEHIQSVTAARPGGRAKALVVTRSRLHAVYLKRAVDAYVTSRGYHSLGTLVSFAGSVVDEHNRSRTEEDLNGFAHESLAEHFGAEQHRLLIVTGAIEPALPLSLVHTLFIDKELDGAEGLDALMAVARPRPGKSDVSVVDFANADERVREVLLQQESRRIRRA
ncbi:MAG: hypothetical protein ACRDKZ_09895 [Actinomycetota bacterium]